MDTEAQKLILRSRAPTRIDLAGGTLDIWPLYLFLEDPVTVNLAIDLFAEAVLETTPLSRGEKGEVTLRSEDQGAEVRFSWEELPHYQAPPALDLHVRLLRHFIGQSKPALHFKLRTSAKSPAGAGLGGSSTLSVAMIGALAAFSGKTPSQGSPSPEFGESLIEIVRDIETTVIQVPAGLQDYYGAMYGGIQCLHWGAGQHRREGLSSEALKGLESRLLLYYSGQSRNSGINNWELFKGFIDREPDIRARFSKIGQATARLRSALLSLDWKAAGEAISAEWEIRKGLATGISTPAIDRALELARQTAPSTGKICGAGGGGCFFVYVMDPNDREKVAQKLESSGCTRLPFRAVPGGLEVSPQGFRD